jgi:hypothetical protein
MLLNVRTAGKLAAPVMATLVEFAGGNPLALQELCDGLSAQQLAGQTPIVAQLFDQAIEHLGLPRVPHRAA